MGGSVLPWRWAQRTATAVLAFVALVAAAATPVPQPLPGPTAGLDQQLLQQAVDRASALPTIQALIVAQDGIPVFQRAFRGPGLDRPVNVKSASKSVISALVGIAIDKGLLEGPDQKIVPLLGKRVPADADPRVKDLTLAHLLSMRAGLERTSGPNYGRWVSSRDWVRFALSRPFVDEPGGTMLYSTGNTHILSTILTRAAKRSTLELAREWLGEPLGIIIPPWPRDPQGVYFGGNDMLLSPLALLRFGELYRQGGLVDGKRVLSEAWIRESWTPRTHSPHTGHAYGYGWFIAEARGHPIYYAWGFGGQMVFVVPSLRLTVVMTSDPTMPSARNGYVRELYSILVDEIIPAAMRGPAGKDQGTG